VFAALSALAAVARCSHYTAPTPTLTIVCPANASARAELGSNTAPVTFADPTTTGGSGPITTNCSPKSGASFPVGSTTVNCSAGDTKGHAAACSFSVDVAPPPVPQLAASTFMAFGDSQTEGKVTQVFPNAYTLKLQALLQARYPAQTIAVIGEGSGGEPATAGLTRFDGALAADNPQAVLLMDGANDINNGPVAISPAIAALDTMGSHAAAKGLPVFLATIPPENPAGKSGGGAPFVDQLNARIVSLAASRQWTLVDVNAAFHGDLTLVGPDGLHPTDAGYQVIAQTFFDRVVAKLEQLPALR
jgi:lysophospholipase L1-like esterase